MTYATGQPMKIAAMFGSSSGAVAATAGGAVLLIAGAVGYTVLSDDPDPVEPAVPEVEITEPVQPEAAPEVAETTDPEPETSPPQFAAPRLDVVRVEPDGSTLIAGQTDPGLEVAILLDGIEVALAEADGAGAFVSFLTLPPAETPRLISAEIRPIGAAAIPGEETVIVAPFALVTTDAAPVADTEPDTDEALAVADVPDDEEVVPQEPTEDLASLDPGNASTPAFPTPSVGDETEPQPVAEGTADPATPEAPGALQPTTLATTPDLTAPALPGANTPATTPIAAGPSLAAPSPSQAPAVVIAGPEGLRITQGPGTPAVQTEVQLDAISYDAQGAVTLAGRGPATADIQVYLNNQPIQLGEVGPNGAWSLQLPDVDPGTYTLSVAELAEDGTIESRVETPFLREDPERVAEAPVEAAEQGIEVITVQPGFTLWGMAENSFGDGILYVQIFEENRDQIRDPNWIFPGQIFRMPEMDEERAQN